MRGNITNEEYDKVKNVLKTSFNVPDTKTTIIAEWNHNRYADQVTVSTNGDYDPILFPKNSMVEPLRPNKSGIVKGYFGIPLKTDGYVGKVYPVDEEDQYKYWKSSKMSSINYDSSGRARVPEIIVEVNYGTRGVLTNKLRIQLEATYVNVKDYTVEVKSDGVWRQVANQNNTNIDNFGGLNIYLQNSGNWSNSESIDNTIRLQSVRFKVTALNVTMSRLQIIEVSARLRQDFSSRLLDQGVSLTEELSDSNAVAPLGAASSNSSTVSLFNNDRALNSLNENSPYFGLIDKNVKFETYFTIAGVKILMSTMHTQNWNNQEEEEVSVELEDCSSFLKNIIVPKVYLENRRVGQIIVYLLNKLGFTNYDFQEAEDDISQVIPYFWTEGEESAWEIISNLARATQTAVWVDEFDEIKIYSRKKVYRRRKQPEWNFSASRRGLELADVEKYSRSNEYDSNVIKANYQPTSVSSFNNGYPKMETVWEQQDTMVLRSSALKKELSVQDTYFLISSSDAKVWPYTGVVNINGEYIRYEAKEYAYYRGDNNVVRYSKIDSLEKKEYLDRISSPNTSWKNGFTGKIYIESKPATGKRPFGYQIAPSGRGLYGSNIPLVHSSLDINRVLRDTYNRSFSFDGKRWDKTVHKNNLVQHLPAPKGNNYSANNSCLRLVTERSWTSNYQMLLRSLEPNNASVMSLGTRLRMKSTTPNKWNEAGLFFKQGSSSTGTNNAGCWFVSVVTTNSVQTGFGKVGRKEINVWKRSHTGQRKVIASAEANILQDVWYDLDVRVATESSRIVITVFLNGVKMIEMAGEKTFNAGPYSGLMVNGFTEAEYEYYYNQSDSNKGISDDLDGTTFYDKKRGDFSSSIFDQGYTKARRYDSRVYKTAVFTDFGSNAHEVREIEVTFDPAPVQHSRLFLTNEQVVCPEYSSDAFGAKFVLINASRDNMVVNGEDKTTLGADNPIDQKVLIYGRKINQDDSVVIEERDEDSILARGKIESEFASPYIQTKSFAKELVNWVRSVWAQGSVESEMKIFGNPLVSIGSVVTINYPDKNLLDNTQHLVVGIETTLGRGIETVLTLRSIAPNVLWYDD